ncbi:MAG: hypothetical protein Q4F15_02365 [Bacillota bacterium]|nr:hypothetical protein [Bacillota bacterium]
MKQSTSRSAMVRIGYHLKKMATRQKPGGNGNSSARRIGKKARPEEEPLQKIAISRRVRTLSPDGNRETGVPGKQDPQTP